MPSISEHLAGLTPAETHNVIEQLRAIASLPTPTRRDVTVARWLTEIAESIEAGQ